MSNYVKFELEDFPKSAVVNSAFYNATSEVDELINNVVSEHLSKIIDDVELINCSNNKKSIDESSKDISMLNIIEEKIIDIEFIKKEAFRQGYAEAELKYKEQLDKIIVDNDLAVLLREKLEAIVPTIEIDSQIAKLSAESIAGIAQKLYLILPVDFEKIIRHGLFEKLQNFYKEGKVTLTIHPDRYNFCKEIVQSDKISSKFKDNFQIIQDSTMNQDDSSVEWLGTRLEYNQEQLLAEIDKIIVQLQTTTNR
jgi:hypothetical protein